MGTFHHGKHELHGLTVVAETQEGETWVGRCQDYTDEELILLAADVHRPREAAIPREEYLKRAAAIGVWGRHPRVVLPRASVASVTKLADLSV